VHESRVRSVRSPREVVAYLLRLRPVLGQAMQLRRPFIQQVGLLIEDLRRGEPVTISRAAATLGLESGPTFRELRTQAEALMPPRECETCNQAIVHWLDIHISACTMLNDIGTRREPRRLREVQERLAEGRAFAARFNDEYSWLKEELLGRVAAARARRRPRRAGFLGWFRLGG
jgi:hypothetical protein